MSTTFKNCPACGQPLTHAKLLLHHPCWNALPASLRSDFNRAPTLVDRRKAYRAILDHLKHERENPPLFALPASAA